jgi:pimeloyl-ACP methyl ester carboxylesterase
MKSPTGLVLAIGCATVIIAGCATHAPAVRSTAPAVAPSAPRAIGCEIAAPGAAADHGEIRARSADGQIHPLYWLKLPAKAQPARGTLVYLAGGPRSHLSYERLARAFQSLAYPQLDVVLYDYFGFNCSSALQDVTQLERHARGLTMAAMADDFVALKRALVGERKVYLMGGSHGAMLGAQIVADHPDEIEKAILFSGDTQSGWLVEGWFRFDAIVAELAARDAAFAANLTELFAKASRGELTVVVNGESRTIDRAGLEVALWLAGGLNASVQVALPKIVRATLAGKLDLLARIYGAELELLAPIHAAPPPTEVSVVTNFHRCNVWYPRSARAKLTSRRTRYLDVRNFDRYWTSLCQAYDRLGEFPFTATPTRPTEVPILSWIGDHDTFDPDATRARFERLSAHVSFEVMPGWSHDFGTDARAGFFTAAKKIAAFLALPDGKREAR